MKAFLATLLCACLVLSAAPSGALAAERSGRGPVGQATDVAKAIATVAGIEPDLLTAITAFGRCAPILTKRSMALANAIRAGAGRKGAELGPITILAPTNAAFTSLLAEIPATTEQLLASKQICDILSLHVIIPKPIPRQAISGKTFKTLLKGEMVEVVSSGSGVAEKFAFKVARSNEPPADESAIILTKAADVIVIDRVLRPEGALASLRKALSVPSGGKGGKGGKGGEGGEGGSSGGRKLLDEDDEDEDEYDDE